MRPPVILPWPPSALSPNARIHWSGKARAAAKVRREACLLFQAAGLRVLPWPRMAVSITFHPPDRRARDLDNMLAASKSLLDGVADATGIDDSRWSISMARGEVRKGGGVAITVEALP